MNFILRFKNFDNNSVLRCLMLAAEKIVFEITADFTKGKWNSNHFTFSDKDVFVRFPL